VRDKTKGSSPTLSQTQHQPNLFLRNRSSLGKGYSFHCTKKAYQMQIDLRDYSDIIMTSRGFRRRQNQWQTTPVGPREAETMVSDLMSPREPLAVKSVHELVASFGGMYHPSEE